MAGVLVIVLLVAFALLCVLIAARTDRRDFEARFPPISDDEFLARCSPGTSRRVAIKVREIVARHLAVEYDRVHPSIRFIEDIGAD